MVTYGIALRVENVQNLTQRDIYSYAQQELDEGIIKSKVPQLFKIHHQHCRFFWCHPRCSELLHKRW